ncbi:MAG: MBL fold metallo-hydrolase [Betaproteobacteria bacterium]
MTATFHQLAPGITVIERGWLNCNQLVLASPQRNVLIDSGYGRVEHAKATRSYVARALENAPLHWLINTHCHSDHMGGNRALREHYACRVTIPEGEVKHVVPWTAQSCWSEEMDQYAEPFAFDDTMSAGDTFEAGGLRWEAHAAPGHDMDALMFFASGTGILMTGDALWERGLGFVWPQPANVTGPNPYIVAALAALDHIESLNPRIIVPGHGAPFSDVSKALADARAKLAVFAGDPVRNARHVAKVMFVFSLLDKREMKLAEVPAYLESVPVYRKMRAEFLGGENAELATRMLEELVRAKAISIESGVVTPAMRA